MTALTQPPGRLLSIADYAALSEDDRMEIVSRRRLPGPAGACCLGRDD